MKGRALNKIIFIILLLVLIFLLIEQLTMRPTKDMSDLTYAVELVGLEKAAVNQQLGHDAKIFKASTAGGLEESRFIASDTYEVEGIGKLDVRLEYKTEGETEILDRVVYFIPFVSNQELDDIWEWVYAQHQALEAHCGHEAEYISGNPMKEELGIRDVTPGNQWVYHYSQYMSVTVAAEGLLRVELYGEGN